MRQVLEYRVQYEDLDNAINCSNNLSEICEFFSYNRNNTRFRTYIKKIAKEYKLEIPCNRKPSRSNIEDIAEYLVENSTYTYTSTLKKKLIDLDILDNICSICGILPIWNNKVLNLHLDHVNGINTDNRIENLRLVCPNCHTQTDTYTSRNTGGYKLAPKTICIRCKELSLNGEYCRACEPMVNSNNISLPTLPQLVLEYRNSNIFYLSKKYGKSRDWIKSRVTSPHKYNPDTLDKIN